MGPNKYTLHSIFTRSTMLDYIQNIQPHRRFMVGYSMLFSLVGQVEKRGNKTPHLPSPPHTSLSIIIHVGATCWDGFVWLGIFVICASATGGNLVGMARVKLHTCHIYITQGGWTQWWWLWPLLHRFPQFLPSK